MKKKFIRTGTIRKAWIVCSVMCACMSGLSSCSDDYDDSELRSDIENLEDRITVLEEWQKSVNTDIRSLQSLVTALENKDYVTAVTPLEDGTGYVISFLKSGNVTIKHGERGEQGEKGEDGTTSVISVKQDIDGKYYWTVDGEWLLDSGNKIPVTGENGDKGDKGDTGTAGSDGLTPYIGDNGNWWIGVTDTGVKAQGNTGTDGQTPHIGDNGNWWIGTTDTGVKAQGDAGADGQTPHIGSNGNWWIGTTDTGVKAQGDAEADGQTPHIGDNGNWWIGTTDTGVKAQGDAGADGQTPHIGDNGNWWIGTTDTGVKAQGDTGADGQTPHIGSNGNWWIGTTDTGVKAQGDKGADAIAPQIRINTDTNEWEISTDNGTTWTSTGVKATGDKGDAMFEGIDNNNPSYVVITLENGETIILPKVITDKNSVYVATAGGLQQAVQDVGIDATTVAKLTITGTLGNDDFTYLKANFSSLNQLDLSGLDITVLPERALQGMPFEAVILPSGLKEIKNVALGFCPSLRTLDIPESVTTLGRWIVEGCNYLETITLHNGLKTLSPSTFYGCGITSIHIPTTVTEIPNWCFQLCENLERIYLHDGITSIGKGVFSECFSLDRFTIPKGVTELSEELFASCHGLKKVNLHENITAINNSAFINCTSLIFCSLPGKGENLLPTGLTEIGTYCFMNIALKQMNMEDTQIKIIPEFAFYSCENLKEVTLPSGLVTIGGYALNGCPFTTIDLPASLTEIQGYAFLSCNNLRFVTCKATTPPTLGVMAFPNKVYKLTVQTGYVDTYKATAWNSYFENIQ
ncbi:leucine-rich repeat protein [uncultured Phocaeicola sp.]|uniref:leucine-rich repeat protein n=5 Tax=uncultured Phocaeicola sp. TaxID=990718 RepID=UPI00260A221A|nr:leucine-rich repeat protein [uncultured Phocaeicola sp.]